MTQTTTKPFISCIDHSYAKTFVKRLIGTFRKDLCICLRADEKGRHAYMPGLMTCISLLELLSGLFIGKLKHIRLEGILRYSNQFMDSSTYTDECISILYEMFRHKIAHLTQPYGIFDTHSVHQNHILRKYPRRRITWKVNASNGHPAIDIQPSPGTLRNDPPWPVDFTHRCVISLHRLKIDIPRSATSISGYLAHLKINSQAQVNFTSNSR
ncbi:MAG: hypothetical protein NWE87_07675 [Candidatus Bathyarchaeota archaeon]|nr:hypothetical protein [Candidatus Bathyarchaeota archaeon]